MSQPSRPLAGTLLAIALLLPPIAWADKPEHEEPATHPNPLKLGFGYTGGLLPLDHSDVGMSDAQILIGWEFAPNEHTFLMPFLIGGFGILTEENDSYKSNPATKPHIAGLFGIGLSGGLNLGPFSPYLAAEGFALPGFGFSVGFGTLFRLHRLVVIDAALHWIRIPNTSRPFGLATPDETSKANLNELGFFVGFEP